MKPSSFFWPFSAALLSLAMNQAVAKEAERPLIPLLKADEIAPLCERQMAALQERVKSFENLKARDAKTVLAAWDAVNIAQEDLEGPVYLLNNVSPDPTVRSAADGCLQQVSKFSTELLQNEKLYALVKGIKPADAVTAKMRKDILENFDDTGVSLPQEKRTRMKEIVARLDDLRREFERNLRDNTRKLSFTPDEIKGLSEDYLAKAKRDDKGNYLLGFSYPDYLPFMDMADNADARRRYQFAFENQGTSRNLELLKETMALRKEMAGLFGMSSYAEYTIRRRMAGSPAAVGKFLGEVQQAVTESEKKEIEELRVFKAQTLQQPLDQTTFEQWDVAYWQQKLKRARYNVDQNELRKYFPTDAAIPWALDVSGRLYGIEFKRVDVPVWHKDVMYYDVFDKKSKTRIGGIYLDPFPRDGKYGHAAAFPVRAVSTLAGRTPISVLVTNFDRTGLSGDEMETMVHEFGHVLHGVLSKTRYASQGGTSVERDFVEAPSQMYEEWARSKESLTLLSGFCKTPCPVIDEDMLKRMTAAHNFGRGMRYARQLLIASYDQALYNETGGDPLAIWQDMKARTPLGYTSGTQSPGRIGHMINHYGAGYYGYMWSESIALDMLSRYRGKLMNAQTGMLYRKTILARGGELRGTEMVHNFLGREPNSKAFFDEISGKRLN